MNTPVQRRLLTSASCMPTSRAEKLIITVMKAQKLKDPTFSPRKSVFTSQLNLSSVRVLWLTMSSSVRNPAGAASVTSRSLSMSQEQNQNGRGQA